MDIVITEPGKASNPYLDRIKVLQGNLAEQTVDAVVTLIPHTLEYRGALNAEILKKAGVRLDKFVLEHVVQPKSGDIYAVPGFDLPCRHIFFCVVPVWKDDFDRHEKHLLNATRKAIELAQDMGLKTMAFPPLGSGHRGFPKQRAVRLIVQGLEDRLDDRLEEVRITCLGDQTVCLFEERLKGL